MHLGELLLLLSWAREQYATRTKVSAWVKRQGGAGQWDASILRFHPYHTEYPLLITTLSPDAGSVRFQTALVRQAAVG